MRTTIALLIPFLACSRAIPHAHAQGDDHDAWTPERRQEVKAQQSAYLTRRMALSPEEAQRFWPIYNRMDDELSSQRKEHWDRMKALKTKGAAPSEAEANDLLDQRLAMREKEQALRRKYDAQFRKSIGPVKTWELYRAERDFHKEMLRSMRQRRGDGPRHDGPAKGH